MFKAPPSLSQSPPEPTATPSPHRSRDGSLIDGVMDPNLNIALTPAANRKKNPAGRIRPYFVRSCKGKKKKSSTTTIDSLPDDLVFDILVHLSAGDIYENAILFCRRWSHVIRTHDFIHAHLEHHSSNPGLLIHDDGVEKDMVFVALRNGRTELSKFNYEFTCKKNSWLFRNKFTCERNCWSSCNGLILEYDSSRRVLQIMNPAIKTRFAVPCISRRISSKVRSCSIAYSPASMEFKVVMVHGSSSGLACAIVTVGVHNYWREVCMQHLSTEAKDLLKRSKPIITDGYVHWAKDDTNPYPCPCVLTLNVETETIAQYHHVPRGKSGGNRYLSMGKSLSLFIRRGSTSLEVLEMESETGEWTTTCNVNFEARKREIKPFADVDAGMTFLLRPAGWLKYREVVVFRVWATKNCFAYNVVTHEIDFFKLDPNTSSHKFEPYTSSLVWMNIR
ncbi:hypothetical protein ABFS83_04G060100 [Erythranthe nasuta]